MSEVFDIPIARTRVGLGARVVLDPAAAQAEPEPREEVPRIARTLALAHAMQRMIDDGEVKDQAELARMLGFTRARVTQILDLALLAPAIQDAILFGSDVGARPTPERDLRPILRSISWADQVRRWSDRASVAPPFGGAAGSRTIPVRRALGRAFARSR